MATERTPLLPVHNNPRSQRSPRSPRSPQVRWSIPRPPPEPSPPPPRLRSLDLVSSSSSNPRLILVTRRILICNVNCEYFCFGGIQSISSFSLSHQIHHFC